MLGKLRASVQLLIESGLLSGSRILVQNTLCSSLVDSLDSDLDSLSLVSSIGLDSNVSLLDLCLELRELIILFCRVFAAATLTRFLADLMLGTVDTSSIVGL